MTDVKVLEGKTAVVTGATGSLGQETAKRLVNAGAKVILAVRNIEKGEKLRWILLQEVPTAAVEVQKLDLSDFDSIDFFVNTLLNEPLALLVNNAGVYHLPKQFTDDGLEMHFAVNYAGPLYLTAQLLPVLEKNGGRVVTVSSLAADYAHPSLSDIMATQVKSRTAVYGRSKCLAAMSFLYLQTVAQQRWPHVDWALAHPGVSATSLFASEKGGFSRGFNRIVVPLMKVVFPSPAVSSASIWKAIGGVEKGNIVGPRGLLHVWGKPKAYPLPRSQRDVKRQRELFAAGVAEIHKRRPHTVLQEVCGKLVQNKK